MACKNSCQLCRNLVISQSISFTGGNLVVNLPAGSYEDRRKICVILAQAIPSATTVDAPVVFTAGTGTQLYPLVNKCCRGVTARGVRTRTRYSLKVETTATGAVFKLLGNTCCQPNNNLRAVNGTAPTTAAAPATPSN